MQAKFSMITFACFVAMISSASAQFIPKSSIIFDVSTALVLNSDLLDHLTTGATYHPQAVATQTLSIDSHLYALDPKTGAQLRDNNTDVGSMFSIDPNSGRIWTAATALDDAVDGVSGFGADLWLRSPPRDERLRRRDRVQPIAHGRGWQPSAIW